VINYGIKLWSINTDLFGEAFELCKNKKIDFIELYIVPGSFNDVKHKLEKITARFILHAPASAYGFNIARDENRKLNIEIFKEIMKFRKILNKATIVIHPEYGKIETALEFLQKFENVNILIENMPKRGLNNEECLGTLYEEIEIFIENGYGFCLDFGHAIKSACTQKIDYKEYISKLITLKPKLFHISDGYVDREKDEHLNLGDGSYDLNYIKSIILKNEYSDIVFETPKKDRLTNDLKNMGKFRNIILAGG
jgi:sugar phosphate isomerase/epimerase